jgi:hypothetical protein
MPPRCQPKPRDPPPTTHVLKWNKTKGKSGSGANLDIGGNDTTAMTKFVTTVTTNIGDDDTTATTNIGGNNTATETTVCDDDTLTATTNPAATMTISNITTSTMPLLRHDTSTFDMQVKKLKKKGPNYLQSLPKIDSSIFSSADFLSANSNNTEKTKSQAKSVYANIGISSNPEAPLAPVKPDCTIMTPRSKTLAMEI